MNLSLRDQLSTQTELIDQVSLELARLERSVASGGAELMSALVDLRSHLVDLTLDGYYPTRLPPAPLTTPGASPTAGSAHPRR